MSPQPTRTQPNVAATATGRKGSTRYPAASAEMFALVYGRLRELAASYIRRQGALHGLEPTDLVQDAYVELADRANWNSRAHFLGVAANAMRELLVDHARRRAALKRGGGYKRVTLTSGLFSAEGPIEALAVHEALEILKTLNARQVQVVELRFFGGMTISEAASFLGVSEATVEADWRFARAWLSARLKEGAT